LREKLETGVGEPEMDWLEEELKQALPAGAITGFRIIASATDAAKERRDDDPAVDGGTRRWW
jgi:hypothetical protein